MKQELKDKWVAALRSGEYKQSTSMGQLRTPKDSDKGVLHCCLGVLAEVAGLKISFSGMNIVSCDKARGYTPLQELINEDAKEPMTTTDFYNLNDTEELSFDEIADIIEERL